ncbi:hypothetical protein [Marivirga sericea]|nr:hypothetical protein [Marivirga sericea]
MVDNVMLSIVLIGNLSYLMTFHNDSIADVVFSIFLITPKVVEIMVIEKYAVPFLNPSTSSAMSVGVMT